MEEVKKRRFTSGNGSYHYGTGDAPRLLPDAIYLSEWYKLHPLKLPFLSTLLLSSSIHNVASFIGFADNFHMNCLLPLSTMQVLAAPLA